MSEFKSTQYFQQIADGINGMSDAEKKDLQKKVCCFPLPWVLTV